MTKYFLSILLLLVALSGVARADTSSAMTIQPAPEPTRAVVVDRLRALFEALRSFDAGNFAVAEQQAMRVNEAYPSDTIAMTLVGATRIKQGKLTGAVEIFKTYTDRFPLEAVAHFYLGLSYHLLGNREKAVENYWTALLLNPTLDAARANLGQLGGI